MLCLAGFRAPAQEQTSADSHFERLLQHYHQEPDRQIIPLTIAYLNRHSVDSAQTAALQRRGTILGGFLTALLAQDTTLRQQLRARQLRLANPECHRFIAQVLALTPTRLFAQVPLAPAYNDMAWAAYGATGATQYLQLALDNCRYVAERRNRNLYLTGATARWSLCSMAQQEPRARAYLQAQPASAEARLVLQAAPAQLRRQLTEELGRPWPRGGAQP